MGYFLVGFSPIPIRVPSSLCNFLKIKSSKREPFLSVKTWNFYCYFSKWIAMALLFQSRGVSCAFISLRFFYIIPPVGLAAESGSWKYQQTFSKSKFASEMWALYFTTRVSKRQPMYPTLSEYLQSASWGAHIHRTLGVRWEGDGRTWSRFTTCGWLSPLLQGFPSRLPGCQDHTTDFSWLHNVTTRRLHQPANYQESPVLSQRRP